LLLGVIVAAAFFPFALVGWDDTHLAVSVSVSLLAACSLSTGIAMALP
jgi:hypothetical protein